MTDTKRSHDPDDESEAQSGEELQKLGQSLAEGDEILVNERQRALTVEGEHRQERKKQYGSLPSEYVIKELTGNGTAYHLLCTKGSEHGPILYKETEWEEKEAPNGDTRYEYPRGGNRVEKLTITKSD